MASPPPEPIGGAALARAASAAAEALVEVARRSGKPGLAAQAEVLRLRVAGAARVNALRYPRALAARETTASLPEERRDWEIGQAYARAAEPPLELARVASDIAGLGEAIATEAIEPLRPDAVAASLLAAGASRAAVALVAVNLTAAPNDPRVREAEGYATAAQEAAARCVTALGA
jgi:hypothetical protein